MKQIMMDLSEPDVMNYSWIFRPNGSYDPIELDFTDKKWWKFVPYSTNT